MLKFKSIQKRIALIVAISFALMSLPLTVAPANEVSAAVQTSYYVATTGSDTNVGTEAQPFKTVEKARDVIRTINGNMTGDIIVYLRGGTYNIDSTISFNESDSGTNGYKVIYQAYSGETPVITGGTTVTGWTVHSGNIYKASVTGVDNFRQLYVDGVRADRARSATTHTANGYYYDSGIDGYIVNDSVIGNYANPDDVELVWSKAWRCHRLSVSSIVDSGSGTKSIIMNQPYLDWSMTLDYAAGRPNSNNGFYVENALELLDQEGEWYYDKTNKVVYYQPRSGENIASAEVYIPNDDVESLIRLQGSTINNQVHNIEIKGLTFKHTTWLRPSTEGASSLQASFLIAGPNQGAHTDNGIIPPAAIEIDHANKIYINNNVLNNLGAIGIKMENDVQDTQITGNTISDTSADAIVIGTWKHNYIDPTLGEGLCTNILVRNNTISKVSDEYWGSPAITTYYGKLIDIQHNEISDIPYTGISMGWNGWSGLEKDSFSLGQNRISWNSISDYMKIGHDGGAIYTLNAQPGSVWEGNYIKDVNQANAALYPDEGSGYMTIKNNVVDIATDVCNYVMMWISTIHHVNVDNTYTNTTKFDDSGVKTSVTNTQYFPNANWSQEALNIISNAGITASSYAPLTPTPVTAGNLAYMKDCSAYYVDGSIAAMHTGSDQWRAVDGYSDSYALANNNYLWRQVVDLNGIGDINKVVVTFPSTPTAYETLYATSYDIKVSTNGTDYSKVATVTGSTGGIKETTFTPVQASYVMIEAVAPSGSGQTGGQMAISELEVYGDSNWRNFGGDVAKNKTASASSAYTSAYDAAKGNDGSTGTMWASTTDAADPTPWWKVDLVTQHKIAKIELVARQDSYGVDQERRNFEVQGSNTSDFSTYTTLGTQGTTPFPLKGTWSCNVSSNDSFRYIRVIRTGATDHHFNFSELRVFENALPTTPKSHWQYENNANDSGSNSNNGTLHGDALYTTLSKVGTHALQLDGTGDYMSSALATTLTDNVSMALWVKPSSVTGVQIIAHNGTTSGTGYGLLNYNNNVSILVAGKALCTSGVQLTIGQWYHIAAVRRNGTWEMYIDGVKKTITNSTAVPNTPTTGTYIGSNHSGGENFAGSVDDARIYDQAMTNAEILALATQ